MNAFERKNPTLLASTLLLCVAGVHERASAQGPEVPKWSCVEACTKRPVWFWGCNKNRQDYKSGTEARAYRIITNNQMTKFAMAYSQGRWDWTSSGYLYPSHGEWIHCGWTLTKAWFAKWDYHFPNSFCFGDQAASRSCDPPRGWHEGSVSYVASRLQGSPQAVTIRFDPTSYLFVLPDNVTAPGQRVQASLTVHVVDTAAMPPRTLFDGSAVLEYAHGASAPSLRLLGSFATRSLRVNIMPDGVRVPLGALVLDFPGTRLQDVQVAMSGEAIGPEGFDGTHEQFGVGCRGTGPSNAPEITLPPVHADRFGDTNLQVPLGGDIGRFQQVFDASVLPANPFVATGIAFRQDEAIEAGLGAPFHWLELDMEVGTTSVAPSALSSSFAQNWSTTPTLAVARKRVSLPTTQALNPDPEAFVVQIPFDSPVVYFPSPGQGLIYGVRKYDHSPGPGNALDYPVDAMSASSGQSTGYLLSTNPNAAVGSAARGGPIVGLLTTGSKQGSLPLLSGVGAPNLGATYQLQLTRGAASAIGGMLIGFSRDSWSAGPLPFGLGFLGATGCSLLVSPDIPLSFVVDANGRGQLPMAVPASPTLLDAELFQQAFLFDRAANALGVTVSNGVATHAGGSR
jgi:hypothetical protein